MDFIGNLLGTPLGYLMKFCYDIIQDYGLAIIVFTLFTKVILFPVSLLVQKNSIKMIKMKPELDAMKYRYVDDKDALLDAQSELYKREKYSPFVGTVPLLIQLPLIFGLIDVVYRPMKHILHFPKDVIDAFVAKAGEIMGTTNLGSSPELVAMRLASEAENKSAFLSLQDGALSGIDVASYLERMNSISMNFLGFDLSAIPEWVSISVLVPIFAGLSALIMCVIQNKINVLQIEQSAASQWGMTIFMIAFSSYFAFIVPNAIGIYWIFGNLFSIPVMYLVNIIYSPKEYIDYDTLNKLKAKEKENAEIKKKNNKLSRQHYKELCKGDTLQKMNLMFYSEQSGFYKYFENIIEALLKKTDEPIYYITSDPNDKIFECGIDQIKPYYISGNQLIALMMKLECKMVVMTTPDLEKYHIKRSKMKRDIEYVYTDHGCTSVNLTYRTGAFDYFDTIFAVSKHQGVEIRQMEQLRNTKKKRIVKVGYGLIDNLIDSYNSLEKKENEKPTILVAPSWQYDNILDSCLDNILEGLICDKYKVIVRPHPQYIRRFPLQMEEIIEKYKDKFGPDFAIETDFSSNVTIYTADMVITDWSAIAYEFSFTTNKPTLFVNTEMKVVNKDYEKIKVKPFDITARDTIGKSISKEETKNIREVVDGLIAAKEDYRQQIDELKNSYFYNLGNSGEAAADYIVERLNRFNIQNEEETNEVVSE
jgi:YidC/Oxa1 family membrane protein insertase